MSTSTIPSIPCYIINVHSNTAVDLDASSDLYKDKVKVQGYALHGMANQTWVIHRLPNGAYTIMSAASGTYIGFGSGEKPQSEMALTGNSNKVEFDILGDYKSGYMFYGRNTMPPLVLDLYAGSNQNGTLVIWYPPHYGPNQKWMIIPATDRQETINSLGLIKPEVQKRIRNTKTGTCLDSGGANGLIHAWAACYSTKQRWYIKNGKNGYLLQDHDTKKYLVANPGSPLELKAEPITEFLFDGNDNDGYYILHSDKPVYALEFENESNTNGIKARVHPSRRQKWYIKDFEY
ncbi:ricin-type beta-trefoil lectin domain protein [Ceratobasidium sp. AG-Ba]|nr:ricin-type beta-trefoil lectin domain protein [Ceratobasidium sp. AG-Ba]